MTLSELFKKEKIPSFSALPLCECRITKSYLIKEAPAHSSLFAVILILPYPHNAHPKNIPAFAAFSEIYDYHVFFKELSEKTSEYLEKKYENRFVAVFADHSPIDERHAAVKASLGVLGDNGLFISNKYGSFVFIGELIAELSAEELEAEGIPVILPPYSRHDSCLKCGLCKKSCPGECLGEDREKCVSHLTQKKGELSKDEKAVIRKSGFVWGCDICAEVCPMNRTAEKPEYSEYFTSKQFIAASFDDIEKMSDDEYRRYPFSWRKKEILKRNFELFEKSEETYDD